MLHSGEILNQMKENTARIAELEKMTKDLRDSFRGRSIEEYKTRRDEYEKMRNQESACYAEIEKRKVLGGILRDNARRAFYSEAMPVILEILKKYEGKPIGEKTGEKIAEEAKEKIGHRIYFDSRSYGPGTISISWGDYLFKYDDFHICLRNGQNKMFDGNRLIVYPMEEYFLYNCGEYVDDPMAHAEAILDAFAELKRLEENFSKACSAFNAMIPSNMGSKYPHNFRSYLF